MRMMIKAASFTKTGYQAITTNVVSTTKALQYGKGATEMFLRSIQTRSLKYIAFVGDGDTDCF